MLRIVVVICMWNESNANRVGGEAPARENIGIEVRAPAEGNTPSAVEDGRATVRLGPNQGLMTHYIMQAHIGTWPVP